MQEYSCKQNLIIWEIKYLELSNFFEIVLLNITEELLKFWK